MRQAIARLPGSMIREVANAGLGRSETCWRSGSAKATRSRPHPCARPPPRR